VAGVIAGIDYAGGFAINKFEVEVPPLGSPPNPEVNHTIDLVKLIGGVKAATIQALAQNPLIASLAVSGASGADVLTGGSISSFALGKLGEKGGNCSYGSGGFKCRAGTGAE
jgi:hypothetical protein